MSHRILVISHVWPFPGSAGQQLRVHYTLRAASARLAVDFLTVGGDQASNGLGEHLREYGCRQVILPSRLDVGRLPRLWLGMAACWFAIRTGLKCSNYYIGCLELSPERILASINPRDYDCVLYEYFHAVKSTRIFRTAGIPTVLDTHNVLWKSLEQRLAERSILPLWLRRAWLKRYRDWEENAWRQFDGVVAINRNEERLMATKLSSKQRLFYAPMGTDLSLWPYSWRPAVPPRLGYYGGLGSTHNQAAARRCYERIMPEVWRHFPEAELWLIGSNPPEDLKALERDRRVRVTGFIEEPQAVLSNLSVVLCPWSGTYGFRSRLVEVMALGVPVIATPDAVDGMELEHGNGIQLGADDGQLARMAVGLLSEPARLAEQSRLARSETERLYSLENTYGRFVDELIAWLENRSLSQGVIGATR